MNVYELEIDSTDLSVCLNCLSLRCPQKHDSQYILRRFHCTPINCEHAFHGGRRAKRGRRDISVFFAQNSFSSKPPTRYCAQELFSSAGCRRLILPSKLIPIWLQILGVPKHTFSRFYLLKSTNCFLLNSNHPKTKLLFQFRNVCVSAFNSMLNFFTFGRIHWQLTIVSFWQSGKLVRQNGSLIFIWSSPIQLNKLVPSAWVKAWHFGAVVLTHGCWIIKIMYCS